MSHKINASNAGLQQLIDKSKPDNHLELSVDGVTKLTVTPEGLIGDFGNSGGSGTNGPAFAAYSTAQTNIPIGLVDTKVPMAGKFFDTNTCYNAGNSRFTPNIKGVYQINWQVLLKAMAANSIAIAKLYKNGALYAIGTLSRQGATTGDMSSQGSTLAEANGTTDYFEVYFSQGDSTARFVSDKSSETYFTGCLVRAL